MLTRRNADESLLGTSLRRLWECDSEHELSRLYQTTTHTWNDLVYDSFRQASLMDYLKTHNPRAVFVGFTAKLTSMPVKAAMTKCYCRSAASMHLLRSCGTRCKAFLHTGARHRLILTTDHGRGNGLTAWSNHGRSIEGAEDICIAVLGPRTAPLGVLGKDTSVTQSQIAGTVAALIGYDFSKSGTNPAPSIIQVIHK